MSVPTADQIRLSRLLSDDLQLRINWAYNLEQEIATLSGGGLTSWGLASQATYVNNGDPNGVVTAVSKGDFCLDVGTPALWLANGAGTVWTNPSSGGGGGAPTGAAGGDLGGTYPNPTVPALTEIETDITALEATVAGPATIPESAVTNLTTDLAGKASATLAVGGDLTGNLPNPTLAAAGPGATGPLGTASRIPIVTIDAKGRVTGLSDVAALLAATGDATGNLPGALTLKNTGPGATGPLGTALRVPVVTIDAQGRTTALTDMAIALGATGDATGTLPGALTLKNTGPGATGPSGSATVVPVVTIDAQGRVTALTTATIAIPESAVTNLTTDLAAKAPIASPTFTGTVTLPGDPASALQAATKQYVDAAIQGLSPKPSVLTASTANLTLSGEQTIDGQLTSTSRVLVKNQTAPAENGIYVTAAGGWARATDFDAPAEIPGAFVFVEKGTAQGATGWTVASAGPFTIGVTSIPFTQFSGAGTYSAGTGLGLTGSTFSIDTAVTVDKTTAQTLTNKTLTSPAISTPSGLVKGDVGLGNVDNTSDATKNAASVTLTNKTLTSPVINTPTGIVATDIASGTFAIGRIPTGTDGTHVPLGGVITAGGPQGDASHTQVLTWNAAGQVTAVTNTAIAIAESAVTGLVADLAAKATSTLASGHFFVGNVSNVATDDSTLITTATTLTGSKTFLGQPGTAGTHIQYADFSQYESFATAIAGDFTHRSQFFDNGYFWNIKPKTNSTDVNGAQTVPNQRTVTDMVTNSTTTITSATAVFTANDVGAFVTGSTDLPAGAFIASRTNSTTVVLNTAATGTHSGQSLTITGALVVDSTTGFGTNGNDGTLLIGGVYYAYDGSKSTATKFALAPTGGVFTDEQVVQEGPYPKFWGTQTWNYGGGSGQNSIPIYYFDHVDPNRPVTFIIRANSNLTGVPSTAFQVNDRLDAPITWITNGGGGLVSADNIIFIKNDLATPLFAFRLRAQSGTDYTAPSFVVSNQANNAWDTVAFWGSGGLNLYTISFGITANSGLWFALTNASPGAQGQRVSGTVTSGSAIVSAITNFNPSLWNIVGAAVTGTGIPGGTTISSIGGVAGANPTTSFTMSANGNAPGDGLVTITLQAVAGTVGFSGRLGMAEESVANTATLCGGQSLTTTGLRWDRYSGLNFCIAGTDMGRFNLDGTFRIAGASSFGSTAQLTISSVGVLATTGAIQGGQLNVAGQNTNPIFQVARINGTALSPTKALSGDFLRQDTIYGAYDTTIGHNGLAAQIQFSATQDFSSTAFGSKIEFYTTPNSSTTNTLALRLGQDQSATFGGAVSGITTLAIGGALSGVTSLAASTTILSSGPTSGIGYATGAGGALTAQARGGSGTLNKVCGTIGFASAALAAGGIFAYTLTNSAIAAGDAVLMWMVTATASIYLAHCDTVSAGSCHFYVRNISAGADTAVVTVGFVVIKAVTS